MKTSLFSAAAGFILTAPTRAQDNATTTDGKTKLVINSWRAEDKEIYDTLILPAFMEAHVSGTLVFSTLLDLFV